MHVATFHADRVRIALAVLFSLYGVSLAHADSITVLWNPSSETVSGYAVYLGSSQRIDVGNTTSYTMTTAVAGQRYCFAISAYNTAGEGAKSGEVCGYTNEFPTLTNPGNRTSTVGQAASLQLIGSDPDGQAITYSATGIPPGLFVGSATGFISGTPTTAGTYSVTAAVFDGALNSTPQIFTWSVASAPTADTTAPSTPSIALSGRLYVSGKWVKASLAWSTTQGRSIDVYRNGTGIGKTQNDGSMTDSPRGSGPYDYRVCVTGTSVCSNTLTLTR